MSLSILNFSIHMCNHRNQFRVVHLYVLQNRQSRQTHSLSTIVWHLLVAYGIEMRFKKIWEPGLISQIGNSRSFGSWGRRIASSRLARVASWVKGKPGQCSKTLSQNRSCNKKERGWDVAQGERACLGWGKLVLVRVFTIHCVLSFILT